MPTTNTAIKFIDDIENRTARCPAMCVSEQGATRLAACVRGADKAIHAAFAKIKESLFEVLTVITNDGAVNVSVFDIYNTGLPKEYLTSDNKYHVVRGMTEFFLNSCVGLYPTRELFNPKSPLLADRSEILSIIDKTISEETGVTVETPSMFWNECVCSKVDGMMKGYAQRVSMLAKEISGHADSKWADAVRTAAKNSGLGVMEYGIIARVLTVCGPQTAKAINGDMPDVDKAFGKSHNKTLKTKIEGEGINITYATYNSLSESAKAIYSAAFDYFKKAAVENVPNPKKVIPLTVPQITLDRNSTIDSTYFDWKVTVRGIPGGTVEVLVRAHSDKGTTYYPENLFAFTKECPKGTLVFTNDVNVAEMVCSDMNHPGKPPMTLNIPYTVERKIPSLDKDSIDAIDLDKTVGMDAGVAVAGLVTTIKAKDITEDMMDWHEAVHAYYVGHSDTNLFAKTATKSTRDDLKRLVDEYESGDYNLIAMLTIGLRDGSPTDETYGWNPVCDPCAPMFAWLMHRTKENGEPFYTEKQIAIIGHTKVWRKFIRQLIANRRHYFFEQAKWDRVHDTMTEVFSKECPLATELNEAYAALTTKIGAERTFILSCELLNSSVIRSADIVSMENLNLNDVEKTNKFHSLYATVANSWHMGPKDGYKLSASKNSNTAKIDFGRPVTKDEIASMCKDTDHWHAPSDITINGNVATIYCEPTVEGLRCRNSEWADHYMKNALHLALLKHDAERILTRKGVLYKEVSAKKTSQTCHACGYSKCAKKEQKLNIEQCLTKKLNFRDGRKFVCGNPACSLHGVMQNADANAAFCIRNRVKFKDSEFANSLNIK